MSVGERRSVCEHPESDMCSTVIGLTPGGSGTVHIYTQTIQETTQIQTIHRTTQITTEKHK